MPIPHLGITVGVSCIIANSNFRLEPKAEKVVFAKSVIGWRKYRVISNWNGLAATRIAVLWTE